MINSPQKTREEYLSSLASLDREQSAKKIAANTLLTLLRSGALALDIKPENGLKVIKHKSGAISTLKSQLNEDSIV